MKSLYIHIPFCHSKCQYCSFVSFPGLASLHERYCRALCLDIELHAESSRVDTLFLGGGTPTVLKKEQLAMILDCCRERFDIDPAAEISLEANPDTLNVDDLHFLRASGFNRISFGIQSFIDDELNTLGRIHDAQKAEQAILDARTVGFDNLSLDLMYGLPGQTVETWGETVKRALSLAPEHLSAYQLSIDEGTGFAVLAERGDLHLPAEDLIVEMDAITMELTRDGGLKQYEISNYSRPGYTCRHNLVYWNNEQYHGFGAGAVSFKNGVRCSRIKDPRTYCTRVEQGSDPIETSEHLDSIESFKETVIMGLRLNSGVSDNRLQQRYGIGLSDAYGATLDLLVKQRLVVFDAGWLRLSDRGRSVANIVLAELV